MQDPGWQTRLDILRRDAETKLLEPLRLHGWTGVIEREERAGEYVIISAERGGTQRRAALLYSSATANGVYRRLDGGVDVILFNGQPYQVEEFAHGITTPVRAADDFHLILLEWNRASAPGKLGFAEEALEEAKAVDSVHRPLLSESPIEAIWARLAPLRSATLARKMITRRAALEKVTLNAAVIQSKGEGVAFALRNAADYFGAGGVRNVSQRVLNLYYGSLSFAFAEMLAAPAGPGTLAELEEVTKLGHGLYTVDGTGGGLEHLVVGALETGFFPAWARGISRGVLVASAKKARQPSDLLKLPRESWVTIEGLFARIPELSDLFEEVFEGPPAWINPIYDSSANRSPQLFGSRERATTTYILLDDDSGRLSLEDVAAFPGPIREIVAVPSGSAARRFRVAVDHPDAKYWWGALALHHSPFQRSALIMPLFGGIQPYRATCFALLYALSILVRYRPGLWRRVQEGDLDHFRALIEAFLGVVERVLSEQFLAAVTGQPVSVHQPGSFFG